ncbi:MAG: hypothetical protein A2381_17935 [Bdellovibrionales bacterium RIFOXYB1_FULL_37_110]|nr:MAG: hypothetical protein A2417_08725 [Bdellovibrionales bacterium RIFOXYC1_FULL_37_79]OFZ59850.1 MAG: hypothetical protein A2381_17935 [Bdellovibrionales bacterium RIFOXYB1_FULL_37_110]OFZ65464.1 MAG: hypothetical protein A2577_18470 [Bdellovibrionales bacterium RIFOXYD1_FULL_36_51]
MFLKIYLIGVLSTFVWDLFWSIYRLFSKRSLLDTNMALIGLRRSMLSGNYRVGGNIYKELAILSLFIIITSATSWLGFCFELGNSIHNFLKNQGEPQSLKEIRWKMKNVPLRPSEVALLDIQCVEIQRGQKFNPEQLKKIEDAYQKRGFDISLLGRGEIV